MKLVDTFARGLLLFGLTALPVSLPSVVNAASTSLTISGTPATTAVLGQNYRFQPVGTDTRLSRLRYSIANKPVWASFDENTGLLSGSPEGHVLGTYHDIRIYLIDWYGYVQLPTFSITVVRPTANAAPTISGQPPRAINVGTAFNFTPTAADPNHNALTFSIRNKPSWATFNSNTGTLAGTAGAADVGTYQNIVISVSDGTAMAALPAFSVTVSQVSSGNTTLTWIPPTENSDGTTLTDLAGYVVHYGQSASNLTQTLKIANPGLSSYVVDNLPAGTWYFAMSSYTSAGVESSMSGVVSTPVL